VIWNTAGEESEGILRLPPPLSLWLRLMRLKPLPRPFLFAG